MDGLGIAAMLLALYGAVLSTILGIHELRKGKPRLKITASHGHIFDQHGNPSEPVILMEAINTGAGAIPISGVGWLNADGSKQHLTAPYPRGVLPMELKERSKCTTAYSCRWFRQNVDHTRVVGLYFQDQTGKKWVGRVTAKDKALWLASKGEGWQLA